MSSGTVKINRREFRKAFGVEIADLLIDHIVRVNAHAQILRRGFWGRLCWLFMGR